MLATLISVPENNIMHVKYLQNNKKSGLAETLLSGARRQKPDIFRYRFDNQILCLRFKIHRFMKKLIPLMMGTALLLSGCQSTPTDNPFFSEYQTPFGVAPFNRIDNSHFLPAFAQGISEHAAEVQAIASNAEAPDFENTIAALDASGRLLNKVSMVFFNLKEAVNDSVKQQIATEVAPLLSKHSDDITFNQTLFARVKSVYDRRDILNLNTEQKHVTELVYHDFERSGAGLPAEAQDQLRKLNEQLSLLALQFQENWLAENNGFQLVVDQPADLDGLPEAVRQSAAEAASAAGLQDKWMFTLDKPSLIPFITYAHNRALRQQLYTAYLNRGNNSNAHDNKPVIQKILTISHQRALLLGASSTGGYILKNRMAQTPQNVLDLLHRLWTPALEVAKKELAQMEELAQSEGMTEPLQSWDWWYYAEKVRKAKYDLDEEQIRPYFQLEKVRDGIFEVSGKLYNLQFTRKTDVPVYHPEVEAYEVTENGKHIAVLYLDYFPRPSKSGGAWCTNFELQTNHNQQFVCPVVSIVCNFTKPSGNTPALLSMDETETFFHEFGHALHFMLGQTTYQKSQTAIPTDFVELPSQILEHWAFHPEVMKSYARHYQTGEVIPDALIEKMELSSKFNQGFATVEYLAAALLDMSYYTQTDFTNLDIPAFEKAKMEELGLIPQIAPRYRTTYFAHIWGGGYAAGYYAYIWAEVLDADAFEAFVEKGIYDQTTAKSFRNHILSKGASDEAMTLYRNFRGAEPGIEPLLKNRGLN